MNTCNFQIPLPLAAPTAEQIAARMFWRDVAIVEGEIKPQNGKNFFDSLVWSTWTGKNATDLEQLPALACHKHIRERGGVGHDEEPLIINVLTRPVTERQCMTALFTIFNITLK
jgi:hypothetical protein